MPDDSRVKFVAYAGHCLAVYDRMASAFQAGHLVTEADWKNADLVATVVGFGVGSPDRATFESLSAPQQRSHVRYHMVLPFMQDRYAHFVRMHVDTLGWLWYAADVVRMVHVYAMDLCFGVNPFLVAPSMPASLSFASGPHTLERMAASMHPSSSCPSPEFDAYVAETVGRLGARPLPADLIFEHSAHAPGVILNQG